MEKFRFDFQTLVDRIVVINVKYTRNVLFLWTFVSDDDIDCDYAHKWPTNRDVSLKNRDGSHAAFRSLGPCRESAAVAARRRIARETSSSTTINSDVDGTIITSAVSLSHCSYVVNCRRSERSHKHVKTYEKPSRPTATRQCGETYLARTLLPQPTSLEHVSSARGGYDCARYTRRASRAFRLHKQQLRKTFIYLSPAINLEELT